jgi:hypothetical protein
MEPARARDPTDDLDDVEPGGQLELGLASERAARHWQTKFTHPLKHP